MFGLRHLVAASVLLLLSQTVGGDDPGNTKPHCGFWPFIIECPTCINGTCQCTDGWRIQNDFVLNPFDDMCLTHYLSRLVLSIVCGLLSLPCFLISAWRTYEAWPIKVTSSSSGLLRALGTIQYFLQFILCVLAACGIYIVENRPMMVVFEFNMVISAISGSVYSLSVFKANHQAYPDEAIDSHALKFTYFSTALAFIITFTICLFGCISSNPVYREVSFRAVLSLYGLLLWCWGILGLVQTRLISKLLSEVNKALAQSLKRSLYVASLGCVFSGITALVGGFLPHFNFHLYLIIQIIASLNIFHWVQSTTPDEPQSPARTEIDTEATDSTQGPQFGSSGNAPHGVNHP